MDLDCRVLCHGDDFCVLGDVEEIKNFEEMLSKKNVYKLSALLRFESSDDRTIRTTPSTGQRNRRLHVARVSHTTTFQTSPPVLSYCAT